MSDAATRSDTNRPISTRPVTTTTTTHAGPASRNPFTGMAKTGAVAVLSFIAGAGTFWAAGGGGEGGGGGRESAAVMQAPAPIIVHPPQVVVQLPPQAPYPAPNPAPNPAPSAPMSAGPEFVGPLEPGMTASPAAAVPVVAPVPQVAPMIVTAPTPTAPPTPTASPTPTAPPTPTPSPAKVSGPPSPSNRLNINTANVDQIQTLPGIGPALAGRIIAYRAANGPYASLADLDKVEGIGPKTLERLAPLITIEDVAK